MNSFTWGLVMIAVGFPMVLAVHYSVAYGYKKWVEWREHKDAEPSV